MKQSIAHVAVVVDDYDSAIEFYTKKLHFTLIEDSVISGSKRWVLVKPKGAKECALLLVKGIDAGQKSRIGNQTGGRVFLFMFTDNFNRDYQNLLDKNIRIVREPSPEVYGTVAVFEDLYGNLWDLIEPKKTEELFYSTTIFRVKNTENLNIALSGLKELNSLTLLENGNVSFEILQTKDDPTKIIIWECYKSQKAFDEHVGTKYFQHFKEQELVEIENSYIAKNIE
jgi:quinol monooxygenase YgiN/predicted enzyme related to lactoylglutathione lyase